MSKPALSVFSTGKGHLRRAGWVLAYVLLAVISILAILGLWVPMVAGGWFGAFGILSFIVLGSAMLYRVIARNRAKPAADNGNRLETKAPSISRPEILLTIISLSLFVPFIGWCVIQLREPQAERETFADLEIIAELKAVQIENWLAERDRNATLSKNYLEREHTDLIERIIGGSGRVTAKDYDQLRFIFRDTLEPMGFDNAQILDRENRILFSNEVHTLRNEDAPLIERALASNSIQNSEIVQEQDGTTHLEYLVPLSLKAGERKPVAVLVLHLSPERFLFPYIRRWPGASASGETLLVRRDGDDVVFLNTLRHQVGSRKQLHLTDRSLPSSVALDNTVPGIISSADYRNIPVLAAYRPITGTDWRIVAKIDRDEVVSSVRGMANWISLFALFAGTVVCVALLLFWHQSRRAQELAMQLQVAESDKRYRMLFDKNSIPMLLVDPESGAIVDANESAIRYYGWDLPTLREMTVAQINTLPPEDVSRIMLQATHAEVLHLEFRHRLASGDVREVEVTTGPVVMGGRTLLLSSIKDVTEQRTASQTIQRLSQLYSTVSRCSQAIAHSTSEKELFAQLCHSIVQFGEIRMAWVGHVDRSAGLVLPVSSFGDDTGYLHDARFCIDPAEVSGGRLVGDVVRCGEPQWLDDLQDNPVMVPGREALARAGWQSAAALPLFLEGQVVGVFVLYAAIPNAFDSVVRNMLIGMTMDINFAIGAFARETARQKAEKETQIVLDQLQKIAERLPGMIYQYVLRPDGSSYVPFSSEAIRSVYELNLKDVYEDASPMISRILPEDREAVLASIQNSARNMTPWQHEFRVNTVAGGIRWLSVNAQPEMMSNGAILWHAYSADISERKQMEEALHLHQTRLEHLVEARTAELIEARNQAESAVRVKSSFLANMSHEIRTPINAVLGMVRLALRTDLTAKQRDYLTKSQTAAESLLGIINDILDLSKSEAGKLEMAYEEFRLDNVLTTVANIAMARLEGKGIEFLLETAPDVPPRLIGDPQHLGQILINLCSNAVKFTPRGEVRVSISLQEECDTERVRLRFSVRDTGIGISPEGRSQLFQPFSQVDASNTRKYSGTGLGLAICKQLVEQMGGEIGVKSEVGVGSEFSFTAVFARGHNRLESASEIPNSVCQRVLYIDDNDSAREIMSHGLHNLGCECTAVAAVAPGLMELTLADNVNPYDLVILDWPITECNGLEGARQIRQLPLRFAPKLILASYDDSAAVEAAAQKVDLDGFLGKPFTCSSLFDAIISAVGRTPVIGTSAAKLDSLDLVRAKIRGCQVLVAEDNELNQQIAYELLSAEGVVVTLAGDGRQALELARDKAFDAILMDVQMPVMDGHEATRLMRRDPQFQATPIIAMTAHAMAEDRKLCLAAGMNDYITKPINIEVLLTTLARWVTPRAAKSPVPGCSPEASGNAGEPSFPQAISGISLDVGLALYSGNKAFYLKLLRLFLKNQSAAAIELRNELTNGHYDVASRIAHSMKSVAGAIGAKELSLTSARLEKVITSQVLDEQEILLLDFEQKLQEVLEGIRDSLVALPEDLPQPAPLATERSLLELLREINALIDQDVGQATVWRENYRYHFIHGEAASEFACFEEKMAAYDLAGAKASLKDVAGRLGFSLEES